MLPGVFFRSCKRMGTEGWERQGSSFRLFEATKRRFAISLVMARKAASIRCCNKEAEPVVAKLVLLSLLLEECGDIAVFQEELCN